jgi:RNA polymerase sigma-70 factor, ECF subfamily
VPDQADAEDLVQETYLRAWQAWRSGRPPRRVEPWLATICLNLGRDRARRATTRLEVPAELLGELADGTDVAAEAIHRVRRTLVERALWALPEPQRLAVTLMDLGGFTAAEAAGILGRPRGTVLASAHRGSPPTTRVGHRGRPAPTALAREPTQPAPIGYWRRHWMGEVVYRSQVTVTRHQGPLRTATVPAEDRPLTFGVHGAVGEHYGTDPKDSEPHATTLDYLVAAAAG